MSFDFKEFPALETDRLILRELIQDDAQEFFEIWDDPSMQAGFGASGLKSPDAARRHLQVKSRAYQRKQVLTWGIVSKESSRLIGACLYGDFDRRTKADISYYLRSDACGQGIMTEALTAAIPFGLGKMGLHRIQALIRPDNHASIRVIEKFGFQREGCLRKFHRKQRGWVDKSPTRFSRVTDVMEPKMDGLSNQFLLEIKLDRERVESFDDYPFSLSVVAQLHKLQLHPHVTFVVGENGAGKSTMLEAIAIAWGLNAEGGGRSFQFDTRRSHSVLHDYLQACIWPTFSACWTAFTGSSTQVTASSSSNTTWT